MEPNLARIAVRIITPSAPADTEVFTVGTQRRFRHAMSPEHKLFEASIARRQMPGTGLFSADRVSAGDGALVVALRGELDLAAVEALREAMGAVADTAGVILDLERVTFVDSSGLRELLTAEAACQETGIPLVIAAPPPQLLRLLDLTGTRHVLRLVDERAAALRMLGG
jgi:anti-anti-sigma factor